MSFFHSFSGHAEGGERGEGLVGSQSSSTQFFFPFASPTSPVEAKHMMSKLMFPRHTLSLSNSSVFTKSFVEFPLPPTTSCSE